MRPADQPRPLQHNSTQASVPSTSPPPDNKVRRMRYAYMGAGVRQLRALQICLRIRREAGVRVLFHRCRAARNALQGLYVPAVGMRIASAVSLQLRSAARSGQDMRHGGNVATGPGRGGREQCRAAVAPELLSRRRHLCLYNCFPDSGGPSAPSTTSYIKARRRALPQLLTEQTHHPDSILLTTSPSERPCFAHCYHHPTLIAACHGRLLRHCFPCAGGGRCCVFRG